MPPSEPGFWYGVRSPVCERLLAPAAKAYGLAAQRRFRRTNSYRSRLPVICVGNFTAGGTGKTPLSLLIAQELIAMGEAPVFLTRGYKGKSSKQPQWVDAEKHGSQTVGDEALLLARMAPTCLSVDRRAGAIAIETQTMRPASVIIMDDGLQNPGLVKDLTIAVVDGRRGIGNGLIIPAGPLRAPLDFQLRLVDAILVNQPAGFQARGPEGDGGVHQRLRREFDGPVLAGEALPRGDTAWLMQAPVVAYAGIGNPERFFDLLAWMGTDVRARETFADHHKFTVRDARRLMKLAEEHEAQLVTTEKDWVRLGGKKKAFAELAKRTGVVAVGLTLAGHDITRLRDMLENARRLGGYVAGVGKAAGHGLSGGAPSGAV